jgi:predicted secreted protein
MRLLFITLVLALSGCGPSNSDPASILPSVVVTDADHNKEISLKKGQAVQIKLNGDGTPDTFWGCKKSPPSVEFLTEGKEGNVFEFNFKILDSGPLTLEYVLFTDSGFQKKKDFTIKIKALDP